VLDGLSTGVAITNRDAAIEYLNTAAESLLGISRERAVEHHLLDYVADPAALRELIARATLAEQSFGVEILVVSASDPDRSINATCRVTPMTTESGDRLLVELVDATSRRQIDREKTLRTQHGVSRKMIRQLAHEIRNPLGGLRGAAQLLERELEDPELAEYTDVIIGEADRLAGLMDALLGPGGPPSREAVNLHELTERVAWLLEKEARGAVRVYRDYDPSLPPLMLDSDQILQALLNIGRNAVAAAGDDGHVIIRTRAATNFMIGDIQHRVVATIDIEDNGPGVPEDLGESIFYPLVTGRDDGTGLGLSLAQDLVSRHDGLIEYTSEPGATVFKIRLPIFPVPGESS
jgi:two-component system nitrogen regulation sensor histidine kinase GlnL